MKMSELKKEFNAAFPRAIVKAEFTDGTYRPLRIANKMIRLIPTYVTLSPMDCTDVKSKKIAEKFEEMINFLKRKGGVVKAKSSMHAMVIFTNDKGKQFEVQFFLERHRSTFVYDEAYQSVHFDVIFTKI